MEKPVLSSNWNKLKATLQKDPAKRKPSDRTTDDKKRKLTDKRTPTRDAKFLKRKRMSDPESESSTPATRRKSTAPVKTETSSRYKENEGRSAT